MRKVLTFLMAIMLAVGSMPSVALADISNSNESVAEESSDDQDSGKSQIENTSGNSEASLNEEMIEENKNAHAEDSTTESKSSKSVEQTQKKETSQTESLPENEESSKDKDSAEGDESSKSEDTSFSLKGDGTKESPYLITSMEDMTVIQTEVAKGNSFEGKYLKITCDLQFSKDWTPIGALKEGTTSEENGVNILAFSGNLDGDGHTLTFDSGCKPLFNYVREAEVRNFNIKASYMNGYALVDKYTVDYGEDGDYNKGEGGSFQSGCPDTITITNVNIKSGSVIGKGGYIGGYASGGNTVTMTDCTVEKNVKIGCKADGKSSGCSYVGSFAGMVSGSFTNCVSYAEIYGESQVGGIVGYKSQSISNLIVSQCEFHGKVVAAGNYVGGIVGSGYTDVTAPNAMCVKITDCSCDGSICGSDYVGGILGYENIVQAWKSGIGKISNNSFEGKITSSGKNVGGIIGCMTSLNRYTQIENNYYSSKSGVSTGIGKVLYVDTSCTSHETKSGATYFNTDVTKPKDIAISGVSVAYLNRTDDPLGNDKANLCYTDKAKVTLKSLTISGSYKTAYTVGESLNLNGLVLKATWSDGSVTNPSLSEASVNGFDSSSPGEKTLTITYRSVSANIKVNVKQPADKRISVTFTLMGDSSHDSDSDGNIHTLANGGLSTWISPKTYKADANTTVKTILEKALNEAGYSFSNPSGNYITSINGLAEFTNGKNAGWMYTINGVHSNLSIAQQYLNDGDVIVFHYTDDYSYEAGGANYGKTPDTGAEIENVVRLIASIGSVTYDSACKSRIDAARKAYNALSEAAKKKVENLSILEAAEKKYNELKNSENQNEAEKVISLIRKIGSNITTKSGDAIEVARTAYDKLTTEQKSLVTNYDKLTEAEVSYAKLTATDEDKEKAKEVSEMIEKLGTITLDSEEAITKARKAYNNLTDKQKLLVENYEDLEKAEERLEALKGTGKIEDAYKTTGDYLESLGTPSVGTIGGEWMVIGLKRSGREIDEAYYENVLQYVKENIDDNGRLHSVKSTENSRLILALTALGKDVSNVGGSDLLKGLSDMTYVEKQGINGPIWALIALDSGNYTLSEGDTTRDGLIEAILAGQTDDGGWCLSGTEGDPDMTGMALAALAPYAKTKDDVAQAVEKALTFLSNKQNDDGSFSTASGNDTIATSESVSQIIVALTALGINPDTDTRFIKNGHSLIDALLSFYINGGGFSHTASGERDGMATEQGYYALTAFYRYLENQTSLYDMTDVINKGKNGSLTQNEEDLVSAVSETGNVTAVNEDNGTGSDFPWWIIIVIVVLAAAAISFELYLQKKRGRL